jgi:hypothetical protein
MGVAAGIAVIRWLLGSDGAGLGPGPMNKAARAAVAGVVAARGVAVTPPIA